MKAMSAYFPGLACWFLSDHYKAAYNFLFVDLTVKLLDIETVKEANVRARTSLAKIGPSIAPTPEIFNCFLAQAFAEMDIHPRLKRADGSLYVACWYRVKNIPDACRGITAADIDNAIGWLTSTCAGQK